MSTNVHVRDVELPTASTLRGGGTMALITLDNGADHRRPTTLAPEVIADLTAVLRSLQERARRGEIDAVGVTGKPYVFAAGADLKRVGGVRTREQALDLARAGHAAYALLGELGVPSFAFVNGVALGGGLELALACDYRTVSAAANGLGLPETSLGLVPGWGGATRLPRLIGTAAALEVILTRPATNRTLTPHEADVLGVVDVLLDAGDFLASSVRWAASVLRGEHRVERPAPDTDDEARAAVAEARTRLDLLVGPSRPAPHRALDLVELTRPLPLTQAFALEDEALADLIMTDQMRASVYAFSLVSGAKRPPDAPLDSLARPIGAVGIVGAGLMAAQIATQVARKLQVPVVMRDIDPARCEAGIAHVRGEAERSVARGRLAPATARRLVDSVSATTELEALSGSDLVIEAVTESLPLKKAVFAQVESVVDSGAVLATNTSALSVTKMAAELDHPERVVGLHFFNPVSRMPLVEVVRAESTDEPALATAYAVARRLGKSVVGCLDRPGFVVNRLLVLLLGRIVGAVERGTPVDVADRACDVLGLPMPPFQLFDLVGPAVGLHVLETLHAELGSPFPDSPGLRRLVAEGGPIVAEPRTPGAPRRVLRRVQEIFDAARDRSVPLSPLDEAGVLEDVLTALTEEIARMLDEGVVADVSQIDTAMILGAGWPFHLGGITPYLDRAGWSERLLGSRFLPDGVANVRRS